MSLKIMLHGRLQEGVADAAGSAPCSGTTPERTRNHVEHILTKLGFTSRAQVAAWVAASQPEGDGRFSCSRRPGFSRFGSTRAMSSAMSICPLADPARPQADCQTKTK